MTLCLQELHFSLPSTFSLHNTNSLNIWESRLIDEPFYRARKSLNDLILENTAENKSSSTCNQPMLIEDIHLCLCAMQWKIWKHAQSNSNQETNNASECSKRQSLRKYLESVKSRLDEILAQKPHPSSPNFGHEKLLPYRYYYGIEDHTQAGWQEPVLDRLKDLLFDAQMLSLLLDLHLSLDIPSLVQVATDQNPSAIEEQSATFQRAREQRRLSIQYATSRCVPLLSSSGHIANSTMTIIRLAAN
ncbi:hypothetical protein LARI1_G009126 [Lachnellula arida]|uniref:Uncharacterized protein n=1 Tax=Lachnellula arida TaxID=1316785 RepID=A0A8T9AY05_9HELO|nr:hypothetical protein LARI1_G009126 [Lachnellula arida]